MTVSSYLYACFAAVLVYRGAVPGAESVSLGAHGVAALEATALGMAFVAIHALRIGDRFGTLPMIYVIVLRTLIFLALWIAIDLVEEIAAALAAGHPVHMAMALPVDGAWRARTAGLPLLFLLAAPCFALRELAEALGPCTLRRMLLGGAL